MPRRTKNKLILGAAAVAELLSISKEKAADLMADGKILCRTYEGETVTTEKNVRAYIENLFANPTQPDPYFTTNSATTHPDGVEDMHTAILHSISQLKKQNKKRIVPLYTN